MTAAPKSILQGCELRYGPLGVHRLCLGCFKSGSKKKISTVGGPRYDFRSFFKIKLEPGQNGYHSTPFGIFNHSITV